MPLRYSLVPPEMVVVVYDTCARIENTTAYDNRRKCLFDAVYR